MTPADARKLKSLRRRLVIARRKLQKAKRTESAAGLALTRVERAYGRAGIARAGQQSCVNNIADMIALLLEEES